MERDNFSTSVVRNLAKRVGNLCSNPDCNALCTGPHSEPGKSVNVGVAAHITAAAAGGPRYDPTLDSTERSDATNGIYLCQVCAKLVDNDPQEYPAKRLRDWKSKAEESTRAKIEKRLAATTSNETVQIVIENWNVWRERGNQPGDSVVFIDIFGAGEIRYSFSLRVRNVGPNEEQLYNLRVQFRSGTSIVFEDKYPFQLEDMAMPPHKWIMREVCYGLHEDELVHYERADSIWFVADILGGSQRIERKLADIDHNATLRVF